jgi:hypothetical protein
MTVAAGTVGDRVVVNIAGDRRDFQRRIALTIGILCCDHEIIINTIDQSGGDKIVVHHGG